jgi:protein-L-isoaspartate(D-aspartate) O-methyltransferase
MNSKYLAEQISQRITLDARTKKAFESIDRRLFVPKGFNMYAFSLDALPLQAGQFISSPLTVAKMTMALELNGADSILEIGCGSGYQAAILSKLVRRVFTVERIEKLLIEAKEKFEKLKLRNINAKFDDGTRGWKTYAPFDRILFSASCIAPPTALFEQLKDGGILVAPIEKNGRQIITRYIKNGNKVFSQELEECLFVPVLVGVEKI